jgi:replication-associated recombination protein RarA
MKTLFEKYRPSTFDEVIGQDKAVKKAELLLARNWGGRAWWISGASGTGKTTIAKIIAAQGADDLYIQEFDIADQLSASEIDKIERDMHYYAPGKGGRAYIVNEAHRTPQGDYTASVGPSGAYSGPCVYHLHNDQTGRIKAI